MKILPAEAELFHTKNKPRDTAVEMLYHKLQSS
jgi:hypothetical protein